MNGAADGSSGAGMGDGAVVGPEELGVGMACVGVSWIVVGSGAAVAQPVIRPADKAMPRTFRENELMMWFGMDSLGGKLLDAFTPAGVMPGRRPLEPLFSRFPWGNGGRLAEQRRQEGIAPGGRLDVKPAFSLVHHFDFTRGRVVRSARLPVHGDQYTRGQVFKGQNHRFQGGRNPDGGARSHLARNGPWGVAI